MLRPPGMVFAGPEPLASGKEMKQVAPASPPCPSWTGFYIGAFGGYKFSVVETDLDLTGAWEGNPLAPGVLAHNHDLDNEFTAEHHAELREHNASAALIYEF